MLKNLKNSFFKIQQKIKPNFYQISEQKNNKKSAIILADFIQKNYSFSLLNFKYLFSLF